jgi:hypothetical protein
MGDAGLGRVGFVVDKVALEAGFLRLLRFPLRILTERKHIKYLNIGQFVSQRRFETDTSKIQVGKFTTC